MDIMDNFSDNVGYLELYSGPMFSGKTSKLLELYKQFSFCGISTMVINHADDSIRYSTSQLSTHDKQMIPCRMVNKLSEIITFSDIDDINDEFSKSQVILINEGQFFEDIVEWVTNAVEKYNKNIYICGLDGDFKRNKFGNWLEGLIPLCDNHTKFHSCCVHCKKKKAIFSHRISNETAQKIIGNECYVPLCRLCYKTLNLI
jgi:thymidine kinase